MASIFSENWTDIVFSGRNQEYGAFELRRNSARNVLIACGIGVSFFAIGVSAPYIASLLAEAPEVVVPMDFENEALPPPEPIDPTAPPPPPPPPPPPFQSTIKFVAPVIVEEVEPDEIPPAQEEFVDKTSAETTVEGDPDGVDLSLLEGTGDKVIDEPEVEQVFRIVEQMPVFPGGDGELQKYLANNTKYPAVARENDIEGTVYVEFVIDKLGSVTKAKVVRGVDSYLDKEALRVVKAMPQWKPGKQNGKEVSVTYTVPIKFVLQ